MLIQYRFLWFCFIGEDVMQVVVSILLFDIIPLFLVLVMFLILHPWLEYAENVDHIAPIWSQIHVCC